MVSSSASSLGGILSFIFVVMMTLGFLRTIYLTRDTFVLDDDEEDDGGNDQSLSMDQPAEADPRFQRQNEPGMAEAGRGTGTGRGQQRAAEAADEERDGLFWDVELVFPTRRRNRQQGRPLSSNVIAGNHDGDGLALRLSELLYRRDNPTAELPYRDIFHGAIRENPRQGEVGILGGSGVDQRQRRALDPRTRKSFIHFRAMPGDGFVSPLKAEIPAPFATTASSASIAAGPEGQIGAKEAKEIESPNGRLHLRRDSDGSQPYGEEEKDFRVGELHSDSALSSSHASPTHFCEGSSAVPGRREREIAFPRGRRQEEKQNDAYYDPVADSRTETAVPPTDGVTACASGHESPGRAGGERGTCGGDSNPIERDELQMLPGRDGGSTEEKKEQDGGGHAICDGGGAAGRQGTQEQSASVAEGTSVGDGRSEGKARDGEDIDRSRDENRALHELGATNGEIAGQGPNEIRNASTSDIGAGALAPTSAASAVTVVEAEPPDVEINSVVASGSEAAAATVLPPGVPCRPGSLRLLSDKRLSEARNRRGGMFPACRPPCGGSSVACPVCLEAFQAQDIVTLVTCGHAFHWSCIERWLERSARCPCCRQDLNTLSANQMESADQLQQVGVQQHLGRSNGQQQQQQERQQDRSEVPSPPPPPEPAPPPATPPTAQPPLPLLHAD
ncbi:unnamed protein product [Ectocarpus sp. 4 AP-2014]